MRTLPQPKSNRTLHAARERRRIANRAAAIKTGWSVRERSERAIMAENLQRLLAASILVSVSDSRAA